MRNQAGGGVRGGGLVKGEGPGLRFMNTEQKQTEEVKSHSSLGKTERPKMEGERKKL